jgi:hypothetical protein
MHEMNERDLELRLGFFCFSELQRLLGCTLFVTAGGKIGNIDGSVDGHDMACLFQGCAVPFMLRRIYNDFRVARPCYMWSHMLDNPFMDLSSLKYQDNWTKLV